MPTELQLWNTKTGEILWEARLPAKPVAVAVDGKKIYVSTEDAFLFRFDAD